MIPAAGESGSDYIRAYESYSGDGLCVCEGGDIVALSMYARPSQQLLLEAKSEASIPKLASSCYYKPGQKLPHLN